jgi:hypothetical protein
MEVMGIEGVLVLILAVFAAIALYGALPSGWAGSKGL